MRRLALVPFLTLALLGGLLPLSALPAAAECPAPGGAGMPAHSNVAPNEVQVLGRGWGHGVGMSQYGARGAARLGCRADQILATYYPGTDLTHMPTNERLTVSLWPDRPAGPGLDVLDVRAGAEGLRWQWASGAPIAQPDQPKDAVWRAFVAEDGRYLLLDMTTPGGPFVVAEGGMGDILQVPLGNARTAVLPQKAERAYRRGTLVVRPFGGTDRRLRVQIDGLQVEEYLYGLSEMPSSWELEALKAQAVAGRSYAMRVGTGPNRRPLWDSASDQVYNPMKERDGTAVGGGETAGQRWVRAVDETAGRVLTYQGRIAQTYYSSSHGGQSESNAFSAFFGGSPLPYLQPVDDTRWEREANSPVATWSQTYTAADVGRIFGVGEAREINLRQVRGAGGRVGVPGRKVYNDPSQSTTYGGVQIVGTTGTAVVSGLEFVQRLNVTRRSELFEVSVTIDRCRPFTDQSGNTTVTRTSGRGRIETAVATSAAHWPTSDHAVIATAGGRDEGFADALSAAPLAARLDAPLLLTGSRELAPAVSAELQRLQVRTVHLMGGTAALSAAVEDQLRSAGYEVRRVSGEHRFATARAAANAAGASPSGDVALALGEDWPDAVSAGALAATTDRVPILLSFRDRVPDVTLQALGELQAERVLLIGGTAALQESVAAQLSGLGYDVGRLGGRTRWETSVAVARDALGRSEPGARAAVLASGATFPDALAAGAVTARLQGGLVLVPRCELGPVPGTAAFLADTDFDRGLIVGGTAAVSDRVREQAAELIGNG